jgi:Fur family transcriptional regulator, ferric uptake regulator
MDKFLKEHNYRNKLNLVGLRATPARLVVMKFMDVTVKPIDVGMILDFLKTEDTTVNQATIFRMMNDFLEKGITRQIQFEDGKARYELLSKGDHHHLICEKCGKVKSVFDNVIPKMEKEIQKTQKFLVKRHSLEFFGLCDDCQK